MLDKLSGYKTYIVAAVTIAYAITSAWQGTIDQTTAMQMILGALGLGALRHGIAKGQ